MIRPCECECGACPECVEAQRVHEEFLAWQPRTRARNELTGAYITQRAAHPGFQPRDPNGELDALLAAEAREMRRLAQLSDELGRTM